MADSDPVADAAGQLAGYIDILERLVAEPTAEGPAPGMHGRPSETPEPWYGPAGRALMDAWEGVPRLEARLRYRLFGHPGPRRGYSRGNWIAALRQIGNLTGSPDLTEDEVNEAARALIRWADAARKVHGIDEARKVRHLPRRAGDALPPRCPYCRCFQLIADVDARLVFCSVPRCQDRNGNPPVASMTRDAAGQGMLAWADGLTEIAPDVD